MKFTIMALTLFALPAFAQIPGVPAAGTAGQETPGAIHPSLQNAGELMKKADSQLTVHLNSATPEQIERVPGLNADLASAIIAARPFKSVADLKNVKGITTPLYNKIKGFVSL